MDRPFATFPTAVAVSYPPMASNFSDSSPYRRSVTSLLSPAAMAAVSCSISSESFWWRAKAVFSTSSTVYPAGYTGIWEMRPTRLPLAITTSPLS